MTTYTVNPVNDVRTEILNDTTGHIVGVVVYSQEVGGQTPYAAEVDGRFLGWFTSFELAKEAIVESPFCP